MTFVIENLTDQTEPIDNFGAALKEFYNYEPYNKYIDEMEEKRNFVPMIHIYQDIHNLKERFKRSLKGTFFVEMNTALLIRTEETLKDCFFLDYYINLVFHEGIDKNFELSAPNNYKLKLYRFTSYILRAISIHPDIIKAYREHFEIEYDKKLNTLNESSVISGVTDCLEVYKILVEAGIYDKINQFAEICKKHKVVFH
ncbi:MAG: hypothetical protein CL760_08785 [Chloroflexi bacterium]|nr:hypothetical protein [Chloroflexota bacterium]